MTTQVIVCKGTGAVCVQCGGDATKRCRFKLRGKRAGEICGRALCASHDAFLNGLCGSHYELERRESEK